MFITLFGIQFSILGLIAVFLGVVSMIILIWKQKMTWYVWTLWIVVAVIWLCHFWLFQDFASLIDTSISFVLAVSGLITLMTKKKKKKRRRIT